MLYLILFLCCAAVPFLVRAKTFFLWLRKKEEPKWKPLLWDCLFDGVFAWVFCSLVFLFVTILFTHAKLLEGSLFYLALAFLICLLRPGSFLFHVIKEKQIDKKQARKKGIFAVALLVYFLLDAFYLNAASLKANKNELSFSASDTSYVVSKSNFKDNGDGTLTATGKTAYLTIDNVPEGANYVTLEFAPSASQIELSQATVSGSTVTTVYTVDINANYESFCDILLQTNTSKIRLTFKGLDTRSYNDFSFTLKRITFDSPIPYKASALRLLFVSLIAFAFSKIPSFAASFQKEPVHARKIKIAILSGAAISLVVLLLIALFSPRGPDHLLAEYPFDRGKIADYNAFDSYVKLFDAFRKGQLHLDADPDPRLSELGNDVYSYYARQGIPYLWDTVFYKGKYFVYFGAAPVILVSFPVYWITGCVATGLFLQFVAFILAIAAFAYLAVLLTQLFHFKPNPLAYAFLVACLLFSGLFFNMVVFRMTDFQYRVPIDYSLMAMLWFLATTLEAYRGRFRPVCLGFAGFFFAVAIGSRADFGIWLLFALPFLLKMLFEKGVPIKKKIIAFAPMAGTLVLGATLIMLYNGLRFGNPLNFGQNYQLTISDMSVYSVGFDDIPGALFHFFLQPPSIRSTFGYISTAYTTMPFDTHPYQSTTIGACFNPAFYLILFLGIIFLYEGKWEWKASFVLMPIACLIESIVTYALAGTCFRYMLLLYPLIALMGLFGFAAMMGSRLEKQAKTILTGIAFALSLGGMLFGTQLVPGTFDGMRGTDMGGFFYYCLRDLLGSYNTH